MSLLEQNNKRRRALLGDGGNSLVIMIALNAIFFGIFNFIKVAFFLSGEGAENYVTHILNWVLVPGDLHGLAQRPWSVLTYMFVHDGAGLAGVWRLVGNMLWLWMFGYILQDLTGNRHLAPIYLYGGMVGALFFVLTVNAFPVLRSTLPGMEPLMGANAAVMAVAVATTALTPNYRIFPFLNGGIPLWVLTLIFVAVDYGLVAGYGAGIGVAHLAGALAGYLYVMGLKSGKDFGSWMHRFQHWLLTVFEPKNTVSPKLRLREEIFYKQGRQQPYQKKPQVTQQKIDDILDKISQHGYGHLTEEEKEYLKTASKEVD